MLKPQRPANEAQRLDVLRRARILDSPPDEGFDDLIAIAAAICQVPYALVSLVDEERQWFVARFGIELEQTTRDDSFCAHSLLYPDRMMVVPDARQDPRFHDNPFVTGEPRIRFYAGAPLLAPDGMPLGSFCVMDREVRTLTDEQSRALEALSRQASRLIELRRVSVELQHHLRERDWYEEQLLQSHLALERENASLVQMSRTDPLTGLPNRRAFAEEIEAVAAAGVPYAVAICDIDRFKLINDSYGHAEGDQVLCAVADALRGRHAARGRVARVGGEEFVVLFPGMSREQALVECETLRHAIEQLPIRHRVTMSVGVAEGATGESIKSVFARADDALYAAKHGGRNRVEAG
ncbi:sensor domain-containing diguanylate cyclase [Luteimonas yindakuii]|uniref:Sensor domain-containing diguanylate cyclase n=1 Tax=Luteimonas yindakuii TaxID=2565782 RepID=A0A4Z1R3K3_9GAMM|nr:sensor domain-containing diguanylate cyclase [Luteimonas yindakuii]TKS53486.1 sensor domain-containing diguanylate cyclase [Luteimonas yindakuii]